ncbi:hypothetical protein GCM10012288_01090 [Malaciobacter pacificus]|uniref:Putative membrane protein n=1 Tax=Malaciobacter pacificus TaxID=1080223 RepID=A0A5C2H328_9BACT|nr:hypothetical protein [Malaciobacter pacificus]QEP33367.1 putative membrane protein [Malaciobacter pacificus]GGD30838.1 hypothetical protein GCM10012288_01090 [Malaciobacter pacificus]
MKKELLIYSCIFIILSILMHFDQWVSYPVDHMLNLKTSGAYGLGVYHPFVFTLILYILFLVPRAIIKLFKKY